jgi:hypothetical protein
VPAPARSGPQAPTAAAAAADDDDDDNPPVVGGVGEGVGRVLLLLRWAQAPTGIPPAAAAAVDVGGAGCRRRWRWTALGKHSR